MTPEEVSVRLGALSAPWCTTDLVQALLGIDLPADPHLASALRAWSERFRGDPDVERSAGTGRMVHRHALETFLLQNGWVSWKWAAVHLALIEDDLKKVVALLEGKGLIPQLASKHRRGLFPTDVDTARLELLGHDEAP